MTTPCRLALVCCTALFAAACISNAPPSPHRVLTRDAEPLRTIFNANVGKVRILELVSPT
jgi:hypothetical protein